MTNISIHRLRLDLDPLSNVIGKPSSLLYVIEQLDFFKEFGDRVKMLLCWHHLQALQLLSQVWSFVSHLLIGVTFLVGIFVHDDHGDFGHIDRVMTRVTFDFFCLVGR